MPGKIRFGVYELDRDAMELRKHGVPIRLQEQPFRVLAMLAERPGEVVTREELQEQIWGNTFVDFDQSLNKAVNRVREALNDNAGTPQYVETVPRRGYRFIAPVAAVPQTEEPPVVSLGPAAGSANPAPEITIPRLVLTALAMAIVLAAVGITDRCTAKAAQQAHLAGSQASQVLWSGRPRFREMESCSPICRVLVVATPHIWVQQTAGGEAVPRDLWSRSRKAP